jgi:uncharacterized protein (DUF58 family)
VRHAPRLAALGIALFLLAGAFGVRALLVPGIALVGLALAAPLSVRASAWRVRLERVPHTATIEEGAAVRLELRVHGRYAALRGGEIATHPDARFRPLRHQPAEPLELAVRPARRGVRTLGPAALRFRDPFRISERTLLSPACELLVLPRVERVPREHLALLLTLVRSGRASAPGALGAELDTLRPYRPGAPASLIHWPTVARSGVLMERILRDEREHVPLLVLDATSPQSEHALDDAVRATASLCVALARVGGCSLLLPGRARPERVAGDLLAWPVLHTRLALLGPGPAPTAEAIGQAPIVIWVSAAPAPQRARGRGALVSVSPFPDERRPIMFSVAGCAVQSAARPSAARPGTAQPGTARPGAEQPGTEQAA